MVVEDESLLLQAITKKLQISDIKPISCSSGKQALDYLSNLLELPDAIWLDYHLQDMDGLAFMAELKKVPKLANIPVIVISNSASDDKIHSMLALGASQYLLKAEHRLDDLVTTVRKYITEGNNNEQ